MKLKTFSRGVHPAYNKELASSSSISPIKPFPSRLSIPMSQHLGGASEPLVKRGDEVTIGQLIGKATGFMGVNIHSPAFGKVSKVSPKPLVGGKMANYIDIDVDVEKTSNFVWQKVNLDINSLSKQDIINRIKEAGTVGLGGATFPTHIKYNVPEGKIIDTLIINGAECEPYLTCDHRLMLEKADEIIKGIEIVAKLFPLKNIYIGIEDNKSDAIAIFNEAIKSSKLNITVSALKTKYPEGAEKMLIRAITKRVVPSLKLPLDVGVVVSNVGTIYSIYEAFYFNKPLIDRVVTISGDLVKKGLNILAPIGTPFENLVSLVELTSPEIYKVVVGGPMMGIAIPTIDYTVTKGTCGILLLSEKISKAFDETPCIKCGSCAKSCPMGLMPFNLAAYTKAKKFDIVKNYNAFDCIECGCCSYVCPAKIDIVGWIRYAKNYIKATQNKNNSK